MIVEGLPDSDLHQSPRTCGWRISKAHFPRAAPHPAPHFVPGSSTLPASGFKFPERFPSSRHFLLLFREGRALVAPEPRPQAGGVPLCRRRAFLRKSSSFKATSGMEEGSRGRGLGHPEALRFADDSTETQGRTASRAELQPHRASSPAVPGARAWHTHSFLGRAPWGLGPGCSSRTRPEHRAGQCPGGPSERDVSASFPLGCPRPSPVRPAQQAASLPTWRACPLLLPCGHVSCHCLPRPRLSHCQVRKSGETPDQNRIHISAPVKTPRNCPDQTIRQPTLVAVMGAPGRSLGVTGELAKPHVTA